MSKVEDLARRYKAVLDAKASQHARAEDRDAQRRARALQARAELLDELAEFGRVLGHIAVIADDGDVVFVYGERRLRFDQEDGGTDVIVVFDSDGAIPVRWSPAAGWRLMLRTDDGRQEVPLYDEGLSALLVGGLGLPPLPGDEGPRPWAVFLDRVVQVVAEPTEGS